TNADVTTVLSGTLAAAFTDDASLFQFVPPDVPSVTRYDLKDPQNGWHSVLITTQRLVDATSGSILSQFSSSFFEPYGIRDPEAFLGSAGTEIVTAKFDEEGEKPVVIATVKDVAKLKLSLLPEL